MSAVDLEFDHNILWYCATVKSDYKNVLQVFHTES